MTNVDDLTAELMADLSQYTNEVSEAVKKAVDEVAKECKENIQADSPTKTGKYKKGWKVKTTFEDTLQKRATVYNSTYGRLTHLLENGHALKRGGRTRAFPHIKKNEQKAVIELEKRVKEAIKNGH